MNTITDPRYGTTLVCDLETDTSYGFQAQYDSITGIIRKTAMQTITTIAELDTLIDETPALYARWSHGPDADAANGWISRRWCPLDIYDDEGQVIDTEPEGAEEAGLSATLVLGRTAIVRWHGDVHGETCYLLTGNEAGLCSDDEPLLSSPEPIAYVSMDLVNEIYDGLRLGAYR